MASLRTVSSAGAGSSYIPPVYSAAEAGSLLFTVNRLSQGGTDGVATMIQYASTQLRWSPDQIVVKDVIAGVRERVLRFVGNRALHEWIDMGSVDEQLQSQAEKLKLYAGADPADGEAQLPGIARFVTIMDKEWLLRRGGRPRSRSGSPPVTDFHDPWLSHICHFGINSQTTRHPLFDHMFREIRVRLLGTAETREKLLGYSGTDDLNTVIELHNIHHPESAIVLPD